jgi:hypothetical protein
MSEADKAHGIEALKKAIDFAASVHQGVELALQDGKVGLEDAGLLAQPVMSLFPLLQSLDQLPKDLADLDEEEKQEVRAYVEQVYDIQDDKVEMFVTRSLKVALDLGDLVHDAVAGDAA